VDYKTFFGSPGRMDLWGMLDAHLTRKWKREDGLEISLTSVCVDSGGHFTDAVYQYTRNHRGRRFFAVKGFGGFGKAFIGKITRNNKYRALLVPLGVDTAKELIFDRLSIESPGPGYMHFSEACDEEYFLQLTAEHCVTKYNKGFPTKVWVKKDSRRNEALDCEVYALAGYKLLNANMPVIAKRMNAQASAAAIAPVPGETPAAPAQTGEPSRPGTRRITRRIVGASNWVNRWRYR
jgi:phage terminase large subunit GpA-like protein